MKKKVLWSLPNWYDNLTPSEAILPLKIGMQNVYLLVVARKKN